MRENSFWVEQKQCHIQDILNSGLELFPVDGEDCVEIACFGDKITQKELFSAKIASLSTHGQSACPEPVERGIVC